MPFFPNTTTPDVEGTTTPDGMVRASDLTEALSWLMAVNRLPAYVAAELLERLDLEVPTRRATVTVTVTASTEASLEVDIDNAVTEAVENGDLDIKDEWEDPTAEVSGASYINVDVLVNASRTVTSVLEIPWGQPAEDFVQDVDWDQEVGDDSFSGWDINNVSLVSVNWL